MPRSTSDDQPADRSLLASTRDDPEAFGRFYDRYERPLLAFLRRATGSSQVASDLASEVFAVVLERSLTGSAIDEPRAFLYGVARNKVAESVRRGAVERRARERLGIQPLALDDDALARIDELGGEGDQAMAALAELPDDQQAAVRARVLGELSYDEIADRLGTSSAVARKRVSRGLATLRSRIRPEQEADA